MAITLSLNVDPARVLEVGPDATLQEIRDAYRTKVKRHHPDHGGEDWAFKILVQSYEALSTARVVRASAIPEPPRRPPGYAPGSATPPPRPGPSPRATPRAPADERREASPGPEGDPARVVEVERLALKHQIDQVWLVTEHSNDDRFLSCSLNLSWPASEYDKPPGDVTGHEVILKDLGEVFASVAADTSPLSADSTVVEGRFSGWLSYNGVAHANDAFERFRHRLHQVGLNVHLWSRELTVPRRHR